MIAYIKGSVLTVEEQSVIVENNGFGYEVFLDKNLLQTMKLGKKLELYIYHQIREDAETLFGFITDVDRRLFATLITVSGVGPKTALGFFALYSSAQIVQAIVNSDIAAINQVAGIGKKSAEKIVVELKDKVFKKFGNLLQNAVPGGSTGYGNSVVHSIGMLESSFQQELVDALSSLGYNNKEIVEKIKRSEKELAELTSVEQAIRYLLRSF